MLKDFNMLDIRVPAMPSPKGLKFKNSLTTGITTPSGASGGKTPITHMRSTMRRWEFEKEVLKGENILKIEPKYSSDVRM